MFSIKAFGKLLVEPKTLGWEHSKKKIENVFENLRVVSTPLKCFQKWFLDKWSSSWRKKELVVLLKTLVITKCLLRTINPCNHITPLWDGA
jgi:hypothetical protein